MPERATRQVEVDEFRTFGIDALLRRVALARRAGDVERARPEWQACVLRATARVRAVVRGYRTANGDRIPAQDHDEVVWRAIERATRRMIHTLEQLDERSFAAAMATCAENECKDHFRRLGAVERGLAGSLDELRFDEGEAGRHDEELARRAAQRAADDEAAFEARARLEAALPRLNSLNRRRAIELRERGLGYEEIADALAVSVDNAYQLYCRGLRDLRGLMDQ